jgi:hypothetical protein
MKSRPREATLYILTATSVLSSAKVKDLGLWCGLN